jgi:hypothetical protein
MLLAWFIAEIIRYAYYVSGMFNVQGKLITWLRYSAFIICYPVGVVSEFFIMYTVFKYDDLLVHKNTDGCRSTYLSLFLSKIISSFSKTTKIKIKSFIKSQNSLLTT